VSQSNKATCTRNRTQKEIKVTSKTAKALQRLHTNLRRDTQSKYCKTRYENQMAKNQTQVPRAVKECKQNLKQYFLKTDRLPDSDSYKACPEIYRVIYKQKVALDSWTFTVHLA
jgi:hypothetical protein